MSQMSHTSPAEWTLAQKVGVSPLPRLSDSTNIATVHACIDAYMRTVQTGVMKVHQGHEQCVRCVVCFIHILLT